MVKISCPYCGLTRTIPKEKAPKKPVKAHCHRCKHTFPVDPAKLQPVDPQRELVESARTAARASQETQQSQAPSSAETEPTTHTGLGGSPESIGHLFTMTWGIFSSRFFTLFGLYLLLFLLILVPGGILGGGTIALTQFIPGMEWLVVPAGSLLAALAVTYGMFWGYGAFIHAVIDQECGFKEALRRGREQVWSFLWALSLSSFLIVGGYLLFFIPGILFSVWFLFVPFIIAVEQERGMDALLKSYEYIKGFSMNSFFKLFILTLVCGAIGAIPIAGPFLSLLTTPFTLVFFFVMYYDLQQIKGNRPIEASRGRKTKWILAGSIGYIVLPIIIFALFGGTIFSGLMFAMNSSDFKFTPPVVQSPPRPATPSVKKESPQASIPPAKVLESNATLTISTLKVDPGENIVIKFHGIDEPAPKDWIALFPVDAPNQEYGEWEYLGSKKNGAVTFIAPARPGVYEARLFLDWPTGGYHAAARSTKIYVGEITPTTTVQTAPPPKPSSPLDKFRPKNGQTADSAPTSFSASVADPAQLYIYVFAINYTGEVRLNGESFYELKGEQDMSYNYTGQGKLKHGENVFDVNFNTLPDDPWTTKIEIKVYSYDFNSKKETIVAKWETKKPNGNEQITLNLTP
ncbi:MAG: hypothetical protein C0615_00685 [Desulfuromonas sp.]|nr:MAG: hypothetical protein C0615_00685 [Desulfuromonas sp.]